MEIQILQPAFLKIKTFIFYRSFSFTERLEVQTNPYYHSPQCPLLLTSCNGVVHLF